MTQGMLRGGEHAVVRAVHGDQLIAQSTAGTDGRWTLEDDGAASTVVAAAAAGIAAVARPIEDAADMTLPERATVTLHVPHAPAGVRLTLDPIELSGFPTSLLWVLRRRPDGAVTLNLLDVEAAADTEVALQRGRYRLAGGLIGMPLGQPSWEVAAVVDDAGERREARDGVVELSVDGTARYEVHLVESR